MPDRQREDEQFGADVEVRIAGQHVNLKNVKSLNTLATIATLVVVCAASSYGYSVASTHVQETKEANGALVGALKEQTQVVRESNCLQTYRGPAEAKAAFCKQVTR